MAAAVRRRMTAVVLGWMTITAVVSAAGAAEGKPAATAASAVTEKKRSSAATKSPASEVPATSAPVANKKNISAVTTTTKKTSVRAVKPASAPKPPAVPKPPVSRLYLQPPRTKGVVSGVVRTGEDYPVAFSARHLLIGDLLLWSLHDDRGRVVRQGGIPVSRRNGPPTVFHFNALPCGVYRLAVSVAARPEVRSEVVWAVFPSSRDGRDKDGMLGALSIDRLPALAVASGLSWRRRLWGVGETRYPQVFRKGKLDLNGLRRAEELETRLGLRPLGVLYAPIRGDQRSDDRKFAAWLEWWIKDYVTPLVSATHGYIRHWDVFYDAQNVFYSTPERYAELLKATAAAIRRIDPNLKIVGVNGNHDLSGVRFYEETFKLGVLDDMDILGVRMGCTANSPAAAPEQRFAGWYAALRNLLRDYGRPLMPIWNIETTLTPPATMYVQPADLARINYRGVKQPEPRAQAAVMSRILAEHYAAGVKYFFQSFSYSNQYAGTAAEFDGVPVEMTVAMAAAHLRLEGQTLIGSMDWGGRGRLHVFRRSPDSLLLAAWITPLKAEERVRLTVPADLRRNRADDFLGNPAGTNLAALEVSEAPIYLEIQTGALTDAELMLRLEGMFAISLPGGGPDASWAEGMTPATAAAWHGFSPVDLRLYATAGFRDEEANDRQGGWFDDGPNDLRLMPGGDFLVRKVPFRVIEPGSNGGKSCVVLRGAWKHQFPEACRDIALEPSAGKLRGFYLLAACNTGYRLKPGDPVFTVRVHCGDGRTEEFALRYRRDVSDWYDRGRPEHAEIGVRLPNPCRDDVTLFLKEIRLSRPETVKSIDLISPAGNPVIPVVVAITAVKAP